MYACIHAYVFMSTAFCQELYFLLNICQESYRKFRDASVCIVVANGKVFVYIYFCMYACVYNIYIYIYTYLLTYTHTRTYIVSGMSSLCLPDVRFAWCSAWKRRCWVLLRKWIRTSSGKRIHLCFEWTNMRTYFKRFEYLSMFLFSKHLKYLSML